MHMVQAPTRWTAEMVRALPEDGNRYEVIEGELIVSPAPSWTHQRAIGVLYAMLFGYLRANPAAYVLFAPADIEFANDTQVQPDLFVVPKIGSAAPRRWEDVLQLLLAIEVLSPSTARTDRFRKRNLYLARGVPEYWIVDLDARLIERWRAGVSNPEIVSESLSWQPPGAAGPFLLELADYFAAVLDA